MRQLRALLEPIYDAAAGRMQVFVATYGADAAPLYAQLNSLPADVIAVDCADRSALADAIAQTGAGKPLALGISTARSARRERRRSGAALWSACCATTCTTRCGCNPHAGSLGSPPEQARQKIGLLRSLRDKL